MEVVPGRRRGEVASDDGASNGGAAVANPASKGSGIILGQSATAHGMLSHSGMFR